MSVLSCCQPSLKLPLITAEKCVETQRTGNMMVAVREKLQSSQMPRAAQAGKGVGTGTGQAKGWGRAHGLIFRGQQAKLSIS